MNDKWKAILTFGWFILGLVLYYSFCSWEPNARENHHYEIERHKIFQKEKFDPGILGQVYEYEKLIAFLRDNADTIVRKSSDCPTFFESKSFGYHNLPEVLQPEFYRLIAPFPPAGFKGFSICDGGFCPNKREAGVVIFLDDHEPESTYDDPLTLHIEKKHWLSFNRYPSTRVDTCSDKMCDLVKDTMMSQNLHYTIRVSRRIGW